MLNSKTANEQCLVAMPSQEGSYFEKTVIYLLEHNQDGAFGLIINKPIDVNVDEILNQINPDYHANLYPEPVYVGGPVDNHRGFVLHRPSNTTTWELQITINEQLAITSSGDILEAMANETGVGEYMVILGYSGWSAGQLEEEIANNAWLTVDIPVTTLLEIADDQRLDAALKHLGIEYSRLGTAAGHG